jgi:adenosylcobinamide-GDP ribazoletransferase
MMKRAFNEFLTALMLLTRIPVGRWCVHSREAVAASVTFFPLVGALVGLVTAAALALGSLALPARFTALVCMLTGVLLTGGIHEDGLADTADGLLGGTTPARRLEIMKDSRLGSFGALALWFALSAKWILLCELLEGGLFLAARATFLAHFLGRAAAVGLLHLQPHVGTDPNRARPFCERLPRPRLVAALLAPALACLLLFPLRAVSMLALVTVWVFGAAGFFQRRIGGITGDCLGATVQTTELAVLAMAASLS